MILPGLLKPLRRVGLGTLEPPGPSGHCEDLVRTPPGCGMLPCPPCSAVRGPGEEARAWVTTVRPWQSHPTLLSVCCHLSCETVAMIELSHIYRSTQWVSRNASPLPSLFLYLCSELTGSNAPSTRKPSLPSPMITSCSQTLLPFLSLSQDQLSRHLCMSWPSS